MNRAALARLIAATFLSVLLAHLEASEGPPPILDITTYTAPSGHYAITVDPSHLHGQGKGSYRLTLDGKEVWAKDLDFTLWQAAVTDRGEVAGYAYTNGWHGFSDDLAERGYGDFVVAILNPDGTARVTDRVKRTEGGLHMPPNPVALGSFIDATSDRFVLRFRGKSDDFRDASEHWQVYTLSTGARAPDLKLTGPAAGDASYFAFDIQPVGTTGLTSVLWDRMEFGQRARLDGLRLSLVDKDAREVWHKEWPAEFSKIEYFSPWDIRPGELTPTAGLQPRQFSYRSITDKARITFEIPPAPGADGTYAVTEVARAPEEVVLAARAHRDDKFTAPPIALESKGTIILQAGAAEPPLNVMDFEIDGRGRIGFVSGQDAFDLVLLDPAGAQPRRIPLNLPSDPDLAYPQCAWIGGDRWIVLRGNHKEKFKTSATIVDAAASTTTPVVNFSCPRPGMRGLVGMGERGFIVLADYEAGYAVMRFSADAKRLWTGQPPSIPAGVAAQPDGTVAVAAGIVNQLATFDDKGEIAQTIELETAMHHKPTYLAGLTADADGGWILHDFDGNPPILRLAADGSIRSKFQPHYADNRTFTLYGGVKRAPDGHFWTSDRAAMLRLDDSGQVDLILGPKPDAESIGEIRCLATDHAGNLYAVDGRNAWVHVFDSSGKHQRTFKPDPTDFQSSHGLGAITVAGDGAVYYQPETVGLDHRGYLKLDADGKRAGFQRSISGEVKDEWFFRPGFQERLVLGYERAFLVSAAGEKKPIERRADRRWLDKPHAAAISPSGAFVIITNPSSWASGRNSSITFFSAAGEPLRTVDLPGMTFPRVAFNGAVACIANEQQLVLIDRETGRMGSFMTPGADNRHWLYPYASPDGREVWLLNPEAKSLDRYQIPQL